MILTSRYHAASCLNESRRNFAIDFRWRFQVLLVISMGIFQSVPNVTGFAVTPPPALRHSLGNVQHAQQVTPTILQATDSDDPKKSESSEALPEFPSNTTSIAAATPSDSFGSMLMKLQRQEEEAMLLNETLMDVASLELSDLNNDNNNQTSSSSLPTTPAVEVLSATGKDDDNTQSSSGSSTASTPPKAPPELSTIDWETAKALDQTVTPITDKVQARSSPERLPLAPLYQSMLADATVTATTTGTNNMNLPPLSRKEHYNVRMGRNIRQLVVNIAASCETVSDWQQFVSSGTAGLYDILQSIHESAVTVNATSTASSGDDRQKPHIPANMWMLPLSAQQRQEWEALLLSGKACRALRDLCALSPNLSAVLSDGMLRSDQGQLLSDIWTLLQATRAWNEAHMRTKAAQSVVGNRQRQQWQRRQAQLQRSQLYILQLLLAVIVATDDAVAAIRSTPGLVNAVLACSSYQQSMNNPGAPRMLTSRRQRWLRRLQFWKRAGGKSKRPDAVAEGLQGEIQKVANQVLAAVGHNQWHPRPGQKGLRILCLDGGGSRGMTAVTAVHNMMQEAADDLQVSDAFDLICGTSTGGIIAFLTGLLRETSIEAVERYNQLIKQIFVKPFLSTPLMVFTTASYDESPFMNILQTILKDKIMLDSRADPRVPLVCCLTSKMSSTPTHVALFRNYNYQSGELPDPFTIDPDRAREELGLPLEKEHPNIRNNHYSKETMSWSPGDVESMGSRHPGSFRVLQRYALRASTAAPTVFKPVMMGGEMYCDGGIVSSNPAAVAIHEARTLFPDVPVELVVSVGTGAFMEQKSAPRIGWDGIIGQIVNSATDGEQIHHVLEDILGESSVIGNKDSAVFRTRYFRFNPVLGMPDEFPIDVTDPEKLALLRRISRDYMSEPKQQAKLKEISKILTRKA